MTNYTTATYSTLADLLAAIEAIDNTVDIKVIPFMQAGLQKFVVITGGSSA